MDFIIKNIWFILFVAWGLPLSYYRSKFRKIVYQTDSWVINIKPIFFKEIKGLFGNIYPNNLEYKKFRNFYRFYLIIYLLLFIAYLVFDTNSEKRKKIDMGSTVPKIELEDRFFEKNLVKLKKDRKYNFGFYTLIYI